MLIPAILAQIALMTLVPVVIMIMVRRQLGTTWSLLLCGALTFVASQALRWPFLWLLTKISAGAPVSAELLAWMPAFNIVLLCVTSGLFEEGARYAGYRFVLRRARRWKDGVTYGLGHGVGEALILGAAVATTFITMLSFKDATLSSLPPGLDPLSKAAILLQSQTYWTMPPHLPLLGGLERPFAVCFHVAMALLVLRAVVMGRASLLLLAMALHAGLNGAAVTTARSFGPVASELMLAIVAAMCLWMSLRARPR